MDSLEERYFERRQIRQAIAFAEAGGIAIHRNLDTYHGRRSTGGMVMERPFLHVLGLRAQLERWARRHRIPTEAIQPEGKRRVAHIDLFGHRARALLAAADRERSEGVDASR